MRADLGEIKSDSKLSKNLKFLLFAVFSKIPGTPILIGILALFVMMFLTNFVLNDKPEGKYIDSFYISKCRPKLYLQGK